MNRKVTGHLLAVITVAVWGTTFISTKVLLRTFSPIEILVLRFALGYAVLWLVKPGILRTRDWRQELMYALAGFTGVGLYYMLENTGLEYTLASNAGVIIATAPFFTAVLAHIVGRIAAGKRTSEDTEERSKADAGKRRSATRTAEERSTTKVPADAGFRWNFAAGFILALAGIAIISFNGSKLELNPAGDLMILGAALCWAFYCIILKKINTFGHSLILGTRRIFAWGLVSFLPFLPFTGFSVTAEQLLTPVNIGNFLFLGAGACAACFLMWNYASKIIGPVSANFYIYLTPVVTLVFSAIVLDEPLTGLLILGTVLTLAGLVVSERGR